MSLPHLYGLMWLLPTAAPPDQSLTWQNTFNERSFSLNGNFVQYRKEAETRILPWLSDIELSPANCFFRKSISLFKLRISTSLLAFTGASESACCSACTVWVDSKGQKVTKIISCLSCSWMFMIWWTHLGVYEWVRFSLVLDVWSSSRRPPRPGSPPDFSEDRHRPVQVPWTPADILDLKMCYGQTQ